MRAWPLALACLAGLATMPSAADGVLELCAETGAGPDICACASEAVAAEVAQDDYALYHRLGTNYGRARARGLARAEAWERAMEDEIARSGKVAGRGDVAQRGGQASTLRNRANAVGRTHRAHIKLCSR